uniref:Nbl1_Borealin_N domain-containing protein n=1 Tax=Bursaphelenchus xylophilus TaxID=6326 RepID=A0A1I7SVJ4_BURXY
MEPHSRLSALSMDMLTASLLEHTVRYDHETSLAETYDNFLANNAALQASGQLCRVMLRLVQEQHERRQATNFPAVAGISAELSAPPRKRSRDDFQPTPELSANLVADARNQPLDTAELMEVDFEPAENAADEGGTLKRKIRKISAQPTSVIVDARRRMGPLTPLNVDANEVVGKIEAKSEFPEASAEVHERRPLDTALHAGTLNALSERSVEVIRNGADIQLPPPQPRRQAPLPRNWRLAYGQSYSATTSPNRVSTGQKLRQRIANSATVQSVSLAV